MQRLLALRHAESVLNATERLNGDPGVPCGLSDRGRDQARKAAADLAGESIDLCVVSQLERARATADRLLAGRAMPVIAMAEFNETTFGHFEGQHWADGYHEWALATGPSDPCPGGGESRASVVLRVCNGYAALLRRREHTILLVTHGAPIRYALDAREGKPPQAHVHGVPAAHPFAFARDDVVAAVAVLERWLAAPAWAAN
ncbi:MAG: ribonuclease / adenosylcobalamin/alpha-ribazole phosphatase [Gaiellaceae bacterium]|jgi:probable phosphoglycerate mutase|nr:ribonuclease / adenosylcobalamin/alpha-ribazole phosphatase [Gaiellaceae bacterium]